MQDNGADALPERPDRSRFMRRLVGVAVLMAMAVIVLPFWLDGSGLRDQPELLIPPRPALPEQGAVKVPEPPPEQQALLEHPPEPPAAPVDPAPPEPEAPIPAPAAVPAPVKPAAASKNTAPAPSAPAVAPAKPTTPPAAASAPPVAAKPAAPATHTPPVAPAKPAPVSAPSKGGWVVQLGSFSDELNARALQNSLQQSGFRAFSQPLFAEKGTVWRVRVGPFNTREEALGERSRLRERLNRDGIVVPN